MRWVYSVNDLLRQHWDSVQSIGLNTHQLRLLNTLSKCHTEALGGRRQKCRDCSHIQYVYHSCRNRHCPSCQGSKREEWIERQQSYLLDVPYYHVVFTLPSELHSLCLHAPKLMYDLLFKSSWETLDVLSKDKKYLGARMGMTSVLHTWSQDLSLHPHLHCIVPGGGLTKSYKWKYTRSKGKYLFPAKVMAQLFRAIYLKHLKAAAARGDIRLPIALREKLYSKRWVVYAKRPFLHPRHVIEYLGRYTHKVAISNYRLIDVSNKTVTFKYKDYRDGSKVKEMTLPIKEFIRRFALHILPHSFVRIRHYGILSYHGRSKVIPMLQEMQNYVPLAKPIVTRAEVIPACEKCQSINLKTTDIPKSKIRDP